MQTKSTIGPQRGILILLIAAASCAVALGQTPGQKPAPALEKPQAKPAKPDPAANPAKVEKTGKAADPLELTPEQQKKVLEIGHHLKLGMDLIKSDTKASESEKVMLTQHLIKTAHKALNALLTPEQRKAYASPPTENP